VAECVSWQYLDFEKEDEASIVGREEKSDVQMPGKMTTTALALVFLNSCAERDLATLPEIDTSAASSGIVALPEDVPRVFRDYFVKYTKFIAPNGKPIHILAQDGWTDDQIRHGRNVLQHLLTDFPGSIYGHDKSPVANAMADRKATMVFFNTEEDLIEAMRAGLANATDLSMQDLRANESPAVGDDDYMAHATRDAAYEEVWHLVHDYGIKPTLPDMIAEMRTANDAAASNGWRAWPEDEPEEHPNEYVGVLIDNYYDLWAVTPALYEGRDIEPGDVPDGHSHFGRFFANSRARVQEEAPLGYALIEKFLHPYLTYTPELPEAFTGTFSMTLDPAQPYTYKSQHLRKATLTGDRDSSLIGNRHENVLIGNAGSNLLEGGGGNDELFGGEGDDSAGFNGPAEEYNIVYNSDSVTVSDIRQDRDGTDRLRDIELVRFSDSSVRLRPADAAETN